MTIDNIKLKIGAEDSLIDEACRRANLKKESVRHFKILRKSLDARDKRDIRYVYSVDISDKEIGKEEIPLKKIKKPEKPILVIGSGPCGLMCALTLAERGLEPVVIERGLDVDGRKKAVDGFYSDRKLNPECNIQFGEGGAGTFSDGKLNTRNGGEYAFRVLKIFADSGAPEEILYHNKPHIGSDNLPKVIKNLRERIKALGGKFLFGKKLEDLIIKDGKLDALKVSGEIMPCSKAVLAIGHSARDTFVMLNKRGVAMEQKDFAVGVRIEHLQADIDKSQYGECAKMLPAADYRLTSNALGRGVYTFCMCPGGEVVAASSEEGFLAVNGMSGYKRDKINANSAVVVQVGKADFLSDDTLAGVEFQRKLEMTAFESAGDYSAPVQLFRDFLKDRVSDRFGRVLPSYGLGYNFYPLKEILGETITGCLKAGILDMDKRLKGFAAPDALLTGVETRTSSPVRVLRGETFESFNVKGLFPAGEGCGYAGGIVSAGADGIKTAEKIISTFKL